MEVHHHGHVHETKKWKEYLFQFFMLFLAVFCGFLAEYQLEHKIEKDREKQFMWSLVEDLQKDTSELKRAIKQTELTARYSDSALFFLLHYKPTDEVSVRFAKLMGPAGVRLRLINTDRTATQLKNSGGMRLIRKYKVVDAILQYWKQVDETSITLERYLVYRNSVREISFRLHIIPEVYKRGGLMEEDSIQQLKVINKDQKYWDELTNFVAMSGEIARGAHLSNVEKQLDLANDLIVTIKKEYHL
jgi:hypothetical protein